jgi:hypothetical protein
MNDPFVRYLLIVPGGILVLLVSVLSATALEFWPLLCLPAFWLLFSTLGLDWIAGGSNK